MSVFLKRGRDIAAAAGADTKVRQIVESILADILARGDAAVRDLSMRFDQWDRADYRLTDAEIRGCLGTAPCPQRRGRQVRAGASA